MADPQRHQKRWTYADLKKLPEGTRAEIIDGVFFDMSPAPLVEHQAIVFEIALALKELCESSPDCDCTVLVSPLDVHLFAHPASDEQRTTDEEEIETTVQPDVMVICDPTMIEPEGIRGAPDLIVEVLSPSTGFRDQTDKLALYERAGVREYWVVNGAAGWMMVYRREADGFAKPDYYRDGETAPTGVIAGGSVDLGRLIAAARRVRRTQ